MKILVIGANGSLGQDIVKVFSQAGHAIIATDREQIDITNREQVFDSVRRIAPDVVINTAAYNFVDRVEDEAYFGLAYSVNAQGPGHIAQIAKEMNIPFVHYSTDYVFAGDKQEGYSENDTPNPISKYGETKYHGEELVRMAGGKYYICRLSKIFGTPGKGENTKESFVHIMLRLAAEKPELKIVDEEVGCPSYTLDIARATLSMLESNAEPGIYHMVNEGVGVTWFDFAKEIFSITGTTIKTIAVPSSEFPKPALRPKFAALKNTKLPKLRTRYEALSEFLKSLSG